MMGATSHNVHAGKPVQTVAGELYRQVQLVLGQHGHPNGRAHHEMGVGFGPGVDTEQHHRRFQ